MTEPTSRTCEAQAALPSGAAGICGQPAVWLATGGYLQRPIALCDACKRAIEESTRTWLEPVTFEALPACE
jgi:hypothetical protein